MVQVFLSSYVLTETQPDFVVRICRVYSFISTFYTSRFLIRFTQNNIYTSSSNHSGFSNFIFWLWLLRVIVSDDYEKSAVTVSHLIFLER